MKISLSDAVNQIGNISETFIKLFDHGSMEIEIYRPGKKDLQEPHEKDEIYVIISGDGDFFHNGKIESFEPGDLFFVPAGDQHRFQRFSDDFATWVIFYGPKGGEV